MICPIRAVGCRPAGVDYARLYALQCDRLATPLAFSKRAVRVYSTCQAHLPQPSSPAFSSLQQSALCDLPWLVWGASGREWQPWPEVPPLIDRNVIRWPSDNLPTAKPPTIVEDQTPDAPAQIIMWQDVGGMLDMWA